MPNNRTASTSEPDFDEIDLWDDEDQNTDDDVTTGELELEDRHALRRVAGLSTELTTSPRSSTASSAWSGLC